VTGAYESNTAVDEYKLPCFWLRLLKVSEQPEFWQDRVLCLCAITQDASWTGGLTLPGVGVSSHLLRRGVGPSAGLPGVGVASQRLPAPGVAPGVASQCAAGVAPGVASQLFMAGVASTVSQSAALGLFLQSHGQL